LLDILPILPLVALLGQIWFDLADRGSWFRSTTSVSAVSLPRGVWRVILCDFYAYRIHGVLRDAASARRSAGCPIVGNGQSDSEGARGSLGISSLTKRQSFPRKRESTPQTFGNALSTDWIAAFAGMTAARSARVSQTTPLPGRMMRQSNVQEAHSILECCPLEA